MDERRGLTGIPDDRLASSAASPGATEVSTAKAAELLEANEQLIVSMILALDDVQTAERSLDEVMRTASLDPLTGLPRRVLFLDRLTRAIASARRHGGRLGLLFIDLDDFKRINDSFGHAAGDAALLRAAQCLQSSVRGSDTVSRHGGDEFLVLLSELKQASEAGLIATKINAALAVPALIGGHRMFLRASIGIAIYPEDSKDPETLIGLADSAMYVAKRTHMGSFAFHEAEFNIFPEQDSKRDTAGREPTPAEGETRRLALREANEALLLATLRESDQRKKAEDSLRLALDSAEMGSWDLDIASDTTRRSPRHDWIFGHAEPLAEWGMNTVIDQFVPEDQETVAEAFAQAFATGTLDFDARIRRADDDTVRWVQMSAETSYDAGKPVRITGVIADVTRRHVIEDQLRQSQKMEAVGQLTGGIAHDFNNLLLVIGGSLDLLARRLAPNADTSRLLDAAQQGVARGAKLNHQLLAFARRQDLRPEVVSVDDLMPTLEHLLHRAANESILVIVGAGPPSWPCLTDPHQLEVAILNLGINACDAMPDGGTLTLTTDNRTLTAQSAVTHGAAPGDYVVVSVSDTGIGMAPNVIARAFEPFYTTKAVGKGTGLGLSQAYGYAKQSGGFISIESEPDIGTTVDIFLPRAERAASGASAPIASEVVIEHGVGSILVVEDDPTVRATTCAMLRDLGYLPIEAGTARAALAIIECGEPVDLVFSDVVMPGKSGIDLAEQLIRRDPEMRIVLTSGYTNQRVIPEHLAGQLRLLSKPYTQAALSREIRRAMGVGAS